MAPPVRLPDLSVSRSLSTVNLSIPFSPFFLCCPLKPIALRAEQGNHTHVPRAPKREREREREREKKDVVSYSLNSSAGSIQSRFHIRPPRFSVSLFSFAAREVS